MAPDDAKLKALRTEIRRLQRENKAARWVVEFARKEVAPHPPPSNHSLKIAIDNYDATLRAIALDLKD